MTYNKYHEVLPTRAIVSQCYFPTNVTHNVNSRADFLDDQARATVLETGDSVAPNLRLQHNLQEAIFYSAIA